MLLFGLLAPKYIGLEAILTLQLIYYSELLIKDPKNIPLGFQTFAVFKYSTGFNDLFIISEILGASSIEKKYIWMNLESSVL